MNVPEVKEDFTREWVESVVEEYFREKGHVNFKISGFSVRDNELQGILSKTYVVDLTYSSTVIDDEGEREEDSEKSIFVKVPLKDPNFRSVNEREFVVLTDVLPKLQKFVDSGCSTFLSLPMPEVIYVRYRENDDLKNVFVLGNLLKDGFENLKESKDLNEEHLNSCLDCLSQLHGTGLAFRKSLGTNTRQNFLEAFPQLEEQIQLKDLLLNDELKTFFQKNYEPFLHFLETKEPSLKTHTTYMKKFGKLILKVLHVLEESGYERLLTLCHGDAKPNNFMFRRHIIDIEDLECEGLESILIDWQGGFLGSVANDLMWVTYPFIEAASLRGEPGKELKNRALEYYFEALQGVLDSFNVSLSDLDLPDNFSEFNSILQKSLVLEFLLVTVIKPVMAIKNSKNLINWYKTLRRNELKGYNRKAEEPGFADIFSSLKFPGFCNLYFKIATVLGGFEEMGKIFFDVMKDSMFEEGFNGEEDDEDDEGYFSRAVNLALKYSYHSIAILIALFGIVIGGIILWQF